MLDRWTKRGTPKATLADSSAGETLNDRNMPLLDPLFIDHHRDAAAKSREFGFLRRDVTLGSVVHASDDPDAIVGPRRTAEERYRAGVRRADGDDAAHDPLGIADRVRGVA